MKEIAKNFFRNTLRILYLTTYSIIALSSSLTAFLIPVFIIFIIFPDYTDNVVLTVVTSLLSGLSFAVAIYFFILLPEYIRFSKEKKSFSIHIFYSFKKHQIVNYSRNKLAETKKQVKGIFILIFTILKILLKLVLWLGVVALGLGLIALATWIVIALGPLWIIAIILFLILLALAR